MRFFHTDVLCIGAGLAGERVAIEAAKAGFNVICLSIVPPRRSHSCCAQGGMQAALGNSIMGDGDSPEIHFNDTVKGSDWGCDQEVARIFAKTAPIAMREMAFPSAAPGTASFPASTPTSRAASPSRPRKKPKTKASSTPAPSAERPNGVPATRRTAPDTKCCTPSTTGPSSSASPCMTACRPKPLFTTAISAWAALPVTCAPASSSDTSPRPRSSPPAAPAASTAPPRTPLSATAAATSSPSIPASFLSATWKPFSSIPPALCPLTSS